MVVTRSQHAAGILEVASKTPLQETKALYSVEELITFVEVASVEPEYGDVVTVLRVVVRITSLDRDAFDKYLPACLALTPNVSIFELHTYPAIPSDALSVVRLPMIEVFESNLPHRSLVSFVAKHPSLRALQLGLCGRTRQCALSLIAFPHINEIRCLVKCAPAILHENVDRLRLDIARNNDVASQVIGHLPTPLTSLHVLTIEFGVEDTNILRAIADNMPWLKNLKMLEKARSSVHTHKARPWANRSRWSATLQKLSQLQRLLILTHGALGTAAGDRESERNIFRRWVGKSHPSLHYIGVMQSVSSREKGRPVFSEWSREDGVWRAKWTEGADLNDFTIF